MKHTINTPTNWPLLDDLHTYLWKQFPLDQFEFVESPGKSMPQYVESVRCTGWVTNDDPNGIDPTCFLDSIQEALETFLRESSLVAA